MKYKKILFSFLVVGLLISDMALANVNKTQNEKFVFDTEHVIGPIKPGGKPIALDEENMKKIVPELKYPRLMSLKDLTIKPGEQDFFIKEGFSFVLRGDFNRDGFADIAFVGKYSVSDKKEESFIAIVTIKGKKVFREFYKKIDRDYIMLLLMPDYKPNIDAIFMLYKTESEDCSYLYWDEKEWQYEECQGVF